MSFRKEMILFGSGGAEQWNVATGAWDKLKLLLGPAVRLAEDAGLRREMGARGRSTALQRYVWDTDRFLREHLFRER